MAPLTAPLGELEQTLLTHFCMSQEVRILMQSAELPPVIGDLQQAFTKTLDGDIRGTFWNDLWASAQEDGPSVPARSKKEPIPAWIHEELKRGFLEGIAAKDHPSMWLTTESITFCGMQFSTVTNSLSNSYVVFKANPQSNEPWSAGSIQIIFYLQIKETTRGPFFIIKPYLPLNVEDSLFDPYRKFLLAAGQLVYEECDDLLVCAFDEVFCHFAHTPYQSPYISKQCIHVLPLDRVRDYFLFGIIDSRRLIHG
jgi:hypothetical protein